MELLILTTSSISCIVFISNKRVTKIIHNKTQQYKTRKHKQLKQKYWVILLFVNSSYSEGCKTSMFWSSFKFNINRSEWTYVTLSWNWNNNYWICLSRRYNDMIWNIICGLSDSTSVDLNDLVGMEHYVSLLQLRFTHFY